jgi:ribosomal protein S18 acetylase RimI-like enzyme
LSALANITTRIWTAADRLDDIMRMVHSAFAGFQPPSGVLDETVSDLARRMRDGTVIVAQAGDEFVGSVFCAAQGDALYVARLATAPAWRRHGVGRALLEATEVQARRIGAKRLTLRVRVTLPENLGYFERAGFSVTGRGQDPGRTPYIAMERWLDAAVVPEG